MYATRKLLFAIMLLFISAIAVAQNPAPIPEVKYSGKWYQYPNGFVEPDSGLIDIKVYTTDQLASVRGFTGQRLFVKDSLRGGLFVFFAATTPDVYAADSGTVFAAPNNGWWVRDMSQTQSIKAEWFGAKGDGVTNNHNAIVAANEVAISHNKVLTFGKGVFLTNSLIDVDLINTSWIGEDSETIISGSFGYAVVQFETMRNCTVKNIFFKSTYSNSIEDLGQAVVYTIHKDVINVSFEHCKFSAPNANTNGLCFYTNTDTTLAQKQINNLAITNCTFDSLGRIGCVIFNRKFADVGYTQAQNIKFNNNIGSNLGLNGNFGFLLSLDGIGQNGEVNNNTVSNAYGVAIENTGYANFRFIGNTFKDFTRTYKPFSFSSRIIYNNVISNNQSIGDASDVCYFFGIVNSTFSGNNFSTTGATAFYFRNIDSCRFTNEYYRGNFYGFYIENSTGNIAKNNIAENCIFSTKGSTSAFAVVRFYGSGVTNNIVKNCLLLRGTGGYFDEQNGATNNTGAMNFNDATFTSYTQTLSDISYGITSIDANHINSGTINQARLPSNVAYLNAQQTFTNINTFSYSNTSTPAQIKIIPASGASGGTNRSIVYLYDQNNTDYVSVRRNEDGSFGIDEGGVRKLTIWGTTGETTIQNGGTHTAIGSSQFTVSSTNKGSIPMPKMTTTQRNAIVTPVAGLQIYNTTTNKINFYNGTAWEEVAGVSSVTWEDVLNNQSTTPFASDHTVNLNNHSLEFDNPNSVVFINPSNLGGNFDATGFGFSHFEVGDFQFGDINGALTGTPFFLEVSPNSLFPSSGPTLMWSAYGSSSFMINDSGRIALYGTGVPPDSSFLVGDGSGLAGGGFQIRTPTEVAAILTPYLTGIGTTTNPLTVNDGGSGDASPFNFNGSAAKTISYNSIGAVPTTRTINGTALSSNVTLTLASSQFANQGTTTTVLHGNAAGNPSWGKVVDGDLSLTTPALGTPSSLTLTNATGLPISTGVSGLGTGVATFLATPSSANLATAVTDETGSGSLVFATSPTLTTPVLGVASATSLAITGTAGAGFISLATQSSDPSAPAGGTVLFSNSNSKFSWRGSANNFVKTFDGSAATANRVYSLPDLDGTVALTANNLSVFASTTSAQLRGVLSDELGTGAALFDGATPTSFTLTNATGLPTAGLVNNAVTYAKIQQVAANSFLGNNTGSTANVTEISASAARTLLALNTSFCAPANQTALSPADATTYYWGISPVGSAGTTAAVNKFYVRNACTIKEVRIQVTNTGTAGSNETSTVSIRVNNTTDNTIVSTLTTNTSYAEFSNTSMSVSLAAGDYFEVKWVTPTWATNPTNVRIAFQVIVE